MLLMTVLMIMPLLSPIPPLFLYSDFDFDNTPTFDLPFSVTFLVYIILSIGITIGIIFDSSLLQKIQI